MLKEVGAFISNGNLVEFPVVWIHLTGTSNWKTNI